MAELSDGESKKTKPAQAQSDAGDVDAALAGARRGPTAQDEAYDIRIGRDGT